MMTTNSRPKRPVDDEGSLWFDTLKNSDSGGRKLTSDHLDKILALTDGVEHEYENGTKHLAESGEIQLLKKVLWDNAMQVQKKRFDMCSSVWRLQRCFISEWKNRNRDDG